MIFKNKNKWVERRIRKWDEHVTRIDAERLIKISRDNYPAEEDLQGCPNIIPGTRRNRYNKKKKNEFMEYFLLIFKRKHSSQDLYIIVFNIS